MNKKIIRLISVICLVAVLAAVVMLPGSLAKVEAASTDAKAKALEDQIAKYKEEQDRLKKEIQKAKNNAASKEYEIELNEKAIESLNNEITAANSLIIEYTNLIDEKNAEISKQEEDIKAKFEQYKDRLRVYYEDGHTSYIVMLLSADSIADFLMSLERMNSVLGNEKKLMAELDTDMEFLLAQKAQLEAAKQNQQKVSDGLKSRCDELETLSTTLANQKYQYDEEAKKNQEKYEEAIAAQKKADEELQKRMAELAKLAQGAYVGGTFNWPVDYSHNIITSKYGSRSYWYGNRYVSDFHLGIDIWVTTGTPVYAANDGTVKELGTNPYSSYGLNVLLDHGGTYMTRYAHLSQILVRSGQSVQKGDLIAYSGNTGNSTGAHLHFEIWTDGKTRDPLKDGILSHPAIEYR